MNHNKNVSKPPSTSSISSLTYSQFIQNEGCGVFEAKQIEDDLYEFACISCKNSWDTISDRRVIFGEGIILSKREMNDRKIFKTAAKSITNHLHSAVHRKTMKNMDKENEYMIP